MVSSSLVDACTIAVFLYVNRGRSTPYFFDYKFSAPFESVREHEGAGRHETRLPVLEPHNRKASSFAAVMSCNPPSSKQIPVICRGPGGGWGSTASLNILAGLNLLATNVFVSSNEPAGGP
jgi:hypothetical protein